MTALPSAISTCVNIGELHAVFKNSFEDSTFVAGSWIRIPNCYLEQFDQMFKEKVANFFPTFAQNVATLVVT